MKMKHLQPTLVTNYSITMKNITTHFKVSMGMIIIFITNSGDSEVQITKRKNRTLSRSPVFRHLVDVAVTATIA